MKKKVFTTLPPEVCMYCNEERDRGSEGEREGVHYGVREGERLMKREKTEMKRERGNKQKREKDGKIGRGGGRDRKGEEKIERQR
jgi:hypothetical protein